MKFLTFSIIDAAKAADIAQVTDKIAKTPGRKVLAQYICMGMAFAGLPPNTLVGVTVVDYESSEAMAAAQYPMSLAGGNRLGRAGSRDAGGWGISRRKEIQEVIRDSAFFTGDRAPGVMQVSGRPDRSFSDCSVQLFSEPLPLEFCLP